MNIRIFAAALACALAPLAGPATAQQAAGPTISNARVRATPPGAPVTAAYLRVEAGAAGADRLLAVKVDPSIAGVVEIHDMIDDNGIMKMRRIEAVEVKPGSPAELAPGGKHAMLMSLQKPLAAGDTVKLTLVFEKAGEITVDAKVEQIGPAAAKAASGHMDGADGGHIGKH